MALDSSIALLLKNSIKDAKICAEELLGHQLKLSKFKLYLSLDESISEKDYRKFMYNIERILDNEPVQYITNTAYFMDLELCVGPGVLIPRPETESLVELVSKYLIEKQIEKLLIADICTGSGCISAYLAKQFPNAKIFATDISKDALLFAKKNIEKYKLRNIKFSQCNLADDIIDNYKNLENSFDVIVSNPPYVPSNIISILDDQVKNFEPLLALDGGKDGLNYVEDICSFANKFLKKNGLLVLELHETKLRYAKLIVKKFDFSIIEIKKDLANKERFLLAYK